MIRHLNKVRRRYKMEVDPEDKAFLCSNLKNGICKIKKHRIDNGYGSRRHCEGCSDFIKSANVLEDKE